MTKGGREAGSSSFRDFLDFQRLTIFIICIITTFIGIQLCVLANSSSKSFSSKMGGLLSLPLMALPSVGTVR